MNHKLRIAVLSVAASAIASAATYRVSLPVDVSVDGHTLKAGTYRVEVNDNVAVLQQGKQSVQAAVRTETVDDKYSSTSIRYLNSNGQPVSLSEIRIGGTKTKLVFDAPKSNPSGL